MFRFIKNIINIEANDRIIIIDGRFWHDGRTGIGRVSELFIKSSSKNYKLIILGSSLIKNKFNVEIIETDVNKFGFIFLLQNILLNLLIFNRKFALIIFPHYFSSGCFLRKLMVVHDLMALTHYNLFFQKHAFVKKNILKILLKIALINSHVLCPSNYSKNTLFEIFKKKSLFIPNGSFLYSNESNKNLNFKIKDSSNTITKIKKVGYVGNLRPHKNINGIITFCRNNNFELYFFSEYKPDLDRTDELLVQFYLECDAIIMLSFCEGFGIPLIEAAMFGKCLFASNIPAFLELKEININYVNTDTIVNEIIIANSSYARSFYCFDQLNNLIKSVFDDTQILDKAT